MYELQETAIRNDFSTSFFVENKKRELVNSTENCQKTFKNHGKLLNFGICKKYKK